MANDTERVIGKLEEFQTWAKGEFKGIRAEMREIRKEVSTLNNLKWQIYGGAAVVTGSFALFFNIIKRFLMKQSY